MTERYQILEPLSSMVELALLNFSEEKPKITIKNHGINIDVPGNRLVPQYISRFFGGDSKEDIYILNSMIINYIEWFIIDNYNGKFEIYKNIALCAVSGMRKLQHTYTTGIAVLSLQYYIVLIMKSISDMEVKRKIPKRSTKKEKILTESSESNNHELDDTSKTRVRFLPKFIEESSNKVEDNCSNSTSTSLAQENINSEFQDDDDNESDVAFKPKSELEVSRILIELGNVADDVGDRDDSSFLIENKIINKDTLKMWTIPMKQAQTIVDITKIKEIWSSEDVDNLYKMIKDCFDMTNEHRFIPKSDEFVKATIKALIDVLKFKDNNFSNIIRYSYGGL